MNLMGLRGIVFSQYKTINDFSEAVGWQRNKSSRVLKGIQEPSGDDMRDIVKLFNLTPKEFLEIFFADEFTKCTKDAS